MIRLPDCALALLLLACAPAAAHAAEPPPPASAGDWLNGYNQIIFSLNHAVYYVVDTLTGTDPSPPAGPLALPDTADEPAPSAHAAPGPARMISNLINEPLTVLASLVVGDLPTAWNAVQRFGINSTAGVLGWWDRASGWGYKPVAADVGLSLCRLGVGEGGYVVLPFIGPRTYRDAAGDVVLVNALLWTTTGAIFNTGVSLQTILIAEAIEVAADIVATRQIDPRAKALRFDDFEKMRTEYLEQRRQRCAGSSAMDVASLPAVP